MDANEKIAALENRVTDLEKTVTDLASRLANQADFAQTLSINADMISAMCRHLAKYGDPEDMPKPAKAADPS